MTDTLEWAEMNFNKWNYTSIKMNFKKNICIICKSLYNAFNWVFNSQHHATWQPPTLLAPFSLFNLDNSYVRKWKMHLRLIDSFENIG